MYLQLDTQFNPFTYDEMVKPLLYYKQSYDEAEAAYSDLVAQTEAWKDIANRENSPEAFEMYQRYSGDLSRAVDDFSQGMTAKNRRALIGLRRRYAQDIAPIARASEAMNAANAFRANAGPDAIFEVGEYNSLDQFLHGQTANNRYQSREALTKRTAAITEAAMAEALRDPEFQKAMGDQYYMITQHTGGSYEDLTEAMKVGIMDNPIANNRFSEIRQQVARSAGISNYDAAGQQAIMDAIDTGLYAGLDKPVRNFQANQDHVTPVQNYSMAMENARLALSAASSGMVSDGHGGWYYDPKQDPTVSRAAAAGASSGSSDSSRVSVLSTPIMVVVGKDDNYDPNGDYDFEKEDRDYGISQTIEKGDIGGTPVGYNDLPDSAKRLVDKYIKGGNIDDYDLYLTKVDRSRWWTGDNVAIQIVPRKSQLSGSQTGDIDYNAN